MLKIAVEKNVTNYDNQTINIHLKYFRQRIVVTLMSNVHKPKKLGVWEGGDTTHK